MQIAGGAKIGYFSQDIDILDPDKNLLRNLQSTSSQSEAKKQKKLQQTGQSLLTRLDKLKQIEKRQSLPIIKMNLLSSKL